MVMASEDHMIQTLKKAGHRPTPQRLMILSAVRDTKGHLTATEILERVRNSYQFIDPSTVYRTLDVLKRMGLISETHMGNGKSTYEWRDNKTHHHLVCRACECLTLLDDKLLEGLRSNIQETYGFDADIDHMAFLGLCKQCNKPRASVTSRST